MMKPAIIRCFVLFILTGGTAMQVKGQDGYPVPEKTTDMLFYFQRSHNKNTVVYEINTFADGKINLESPVKFYWIRFEEG